MPPVPNVSAVLLPGAARHHSRGVRILLTGDAEVEEQQVLRERLPSDGLLADVLKVVHHGSAHQDPAFPDAVRPSVALVPVGAGNTYGHPNEAVLARLARGGARVLRTDVEGDVAVVRASSGLAFVRLQCRASRGSESGARSAADVLGERRLHFVLFVVRGAVRLLLLRL